MRLFQIPRYRSERLIALGRAALAAVSLLAVWLDPSEPARYAPAAHALLAAYLAYAALVLALVLAWPVGVRSARLGLITHAIDLPAFTAVIHLTEGPISPFFVWFVFALFAAALRWQARGVLWTALATVSAHLGLGLYGGLGPGDPAFELNRFVIRSAHLALVALLLGYLCAHEQRLRHDLAQLAAWPRAAPGEDTLRALLPHAARILGARRLVLWWEEEEEPWRWEARWEDGRFTSTKKPGASEPPLPAPLADADFLCADLGAPHPVVLHTTAGGGLARWPGRPLPDPLGQRLATTSLLALRLRGEGFSGHLLALDKPGLSTDDLVLGEIVARHIAADLDQLYLQQRREEAAAAGERIRLAREIHDGALQTLTGLGLQLQAAQRLLATDPAAARARLAALQETVASEQRDLRFFVRQMKPLPFHDAAINSGLLEHLDELARRTERQWGLRVELAVGALGRQLSEVLAHAVYRIVQEALVNAARHGKARLARVRLDLDGERLRLAVADDGRGFPFRGRYDLAALDSRDLGPASIRQRVAALGGDLVVESDRGGARIEVALSLRPALHLLAGGDAPAGAGARRVG